MDMDDMPISRELILHALETFVEEIGLPQEHYDAFCLGLLRVLYNLPWRPVGNDNEPG